MLSASPWQESRGDGEYGFAQEAHGEGGVLCGTRQRADEAFPWSASYMS